MNQAPGQTGQADNGRQLDLEDASFDENYFQDLGMEFNGVEDLVNTFIEDTEAPAHSGGAADSGSARGVFPVEDDLDTSTSPTPQKATKKKNGVIKGPSRRKKRPKGKPRRPLCGYNIFFQKNSKEIQATTAFKDLGRIMGERWKALTEEEKSVYEKEAEKDVVRFRKEMDIYEKKRKERLCPTLGSMSTDDIQKSIGFNYRTDGSQASALNFYAPPGWSAAPASTIFPGLAPSATPNIPSHNVVSRDYLPPPPSPNPVLHVPGQYLGPAPITAALPQGPEISLPDGTGAPRKYRVVYACYRMTQQEANDYMARFAAVTSTATPPSSIPSPPSQTPHPTPHPPPPSPHAARPATLLNPTVSPYHNTPHFAPSGSSGDSRLAVPWPN